MVNVGDVLTVEQFAQLSFSPTASVSGSGVITYTVSDGALVTDASVELTIVDVSNPAIVSITDTNPAEDVSTIIGNISDVDGTIDFVNSTVSALNGVVTIAANGDISYTSNRDYHGSDTITLVMVDNEGARVEQTIELTVEAVSDALSLTVMNTLPVEDVATHIGHVHDFTSEIDLTNSSFSAEHGTVTVTADGDINYQSDPDYFGSDTITLNLIDVDGDTVNQTIELIVSSVNDNPVLTIVDTSPIEDVATVIARASDIDGIIDLSLSTVSALHGTVTIETNGDIVYTSAANYNGTDSIAVTLIDNEGGQFTRVINLNDQSVNDAPVVVVLATTVVEDVRSIIANVSDLDGFIDLDNSSFSAVNGTISVDANGDIRYLSNLDYNGSDTVSLTFIDNEGATVSQEIPLTVSAANEMLMVSVTNTLPLEDQVTIIGHVDDFSGVIDIADSSLTALHGTVTINANGDITYQSDLNYNGSDTISLNVVDTVDGSVSQTIEITVGAIDDLPIFTAADLSPLEDITTIIGNISDVDSDIDFVNSTVSALNGVVTIAANGDISYTSNDDYHGSDTITLVMVDSEGVRVEQTIELTVEAVIDALSLTVMNSLPVEDVATHIGHVHDFTSEIDLANSSFSALHGTVTVTADGDINYQSNPDYFGSDTITLNLVDIDGDIVNQTIELIVSSVNDNPVLSIIDTSPIEDVTTVIARASDIDGDIDLDLSTVRALHGTVTIEANGEIIYISAANYNGTDSIAVTLIDNEGGQFTRVINLNDQSVNDAPTVSVISTSVVEDVRSIIANVSDLDGFIDLDNSSFSAVNGTISVDANGDIRYLSNLDYNGSDTVSLTFIDNEGATVSQEIPLTVSAANEMLMVSVTNTLPLEDQVTIIGHVDDFSGVIDIADSSLTALHGTVTINANGDITYQSDLNYNGSDTISLNVVDTVDGSVSQSIEITVGAVDDAPTGRVTIDNTTPTQGDLLTASNDLADADGLGAVTYQWLRDGNMIDSATGNTYTLDAADAGTKISVSASYTDDFGNTEMVTSVATSAVINVNDAPTGSVTIDNTTPTQGDRLTASNDLADADGLGTVTYQWLRDGNMIDSATGNTYTLDAADAGTQISVSASYTDDFGNTEMVTSVATSAVINVNDAPVIVSNTINLSEDEVVTVLNLNAPTDADLDDTLTITVTGLPTALGTIMLADNTVVAVNDILTTTQFNQLKIVLGANVNGSGQLTYTVFDGTETNLGGVVDFKISAVNDAPETNGQVVYDSVIDGIVIIRESDLLLGASDVENQSLSVIELNSSSGILVKNSDGTWTLTPNSGYTGSVILNFDISDGIVSSPTSASVVFTADNGTVSGSADNNYFVVNESDNTTHVISGGDGIDQAIFSLNHDQYVIGHESDNNRYYIKSIETGEVNYVSDDVEKLVFADGEYNASDKASVENKGFILDIAIDSNLDFIVSGSVASSVNAIVVQILKSDGSVYGDWPGGIDANNDFVLGIGQFSDFSNQQYFIRVIEVDNIDDKNQLSILVSDVPYYLDTNDGNSLNLQTNDQMNIVDGQGGDDVISGGASKDILIGGEGNDTLAGNGGDNILIGGNGNDRLIVSDDALTDEVHGDSGIDTVVFDNALALYNFDTTNPDYTLVSNLDGDVVAKVYDSTEFMAFSDQTIAHNFTDPVIWAAAINDAGGYLISGVVDPANASYLKIYVTASGGLVYIFDATIDSYGGFSGVISGITLSETYTVNAVVVNFSGTPLGSVSNDITYYIGTSGQNSFGPLDNITIAEGLTQTDNLNGGSANDILDGGGQGDTLSGGAGDDILLNGEFMYGEAGDDTFLVGLATPYAKFDGGAGYDQILATADNVGINFRYNVSLVDVEYISANGFEGVTIEGLNNPQVIDFTNVVLDGIVSINGNGDADTITGSAGNDTINGGEGTDTLKGGLGDDTFLMGLDSGYDKIDGGLGNDQILAIANDTKIGFMGTSSAFQNIERISAGIYTGVTIEGNGQTQYLDFSDVVLDGIVSINGNAGNDVIIGSAGDDTINGGTGYDKLFGGLGNDTFLIDQDSGYNDFDGGIGTDQILAIVDNAKIGFDHGSDALVSIETISANGHIGVTIEGSSNQQTLDFSNTTLIDIVSINGNYGNDFITGSDGDDVIDGGQDHDTLKGGLGDDTFLIGLNSGFDKIDGGAGNNQILATAHLVQIGIGYGIALVNIETISANGFSGVTISGNDSWQTFDFTNVTLVGIDSINGNGGDDNITGSVDNDVILGGAGNDKLFGLTGDDTFRVGFDEGFDVIDGGIGTDTVIATAHDVVIGVKDDSGRAFNDIEVISSGGYNNVTIAGDAGNNNIDLSGITLIGIEAIYGGVGDDTITGTANADTIGGDSGANTLYGEGGDDLLIITDSFLTDDVHGGSGIDTAQFSGTLASYTFDTSNANYIQVSNASGIVARVYNDVEFLKFSDVSYNLTPIITSVSQTSDDNYLINGTVAPVVNNVKIVISDGSSIIVTVDASGNFSAPLGAIATAGTYSISVHALDNDLNEIAGRVSDEISYMVGDATDTTMNAPSHITIIEGNAGSNTINGGSGNDLLIVDNDNLDDTVSGGDGIDTVVFSGIKDDYTFVYGVNQVTVTENGNAVAIVSDDIEFLQFSNVKISYNGLPEILSVTYLAASNSYLFEGVIDPAILQGKLIMYFNAMTNDANDFDVLVTVDGNGNFSYDLGNIGGSDTYTINVGVLDSSDVLIAGSLSNDVTYYKNHQLGDITYTATPMDNITVIDRQYGTGTMTGGNEDDIIYSNTRGNTFIGGGGDDTFVINQGDSNNGYHVFDGGTGYDRIIVDADGTTIFMEGITSVNNIEEISANGFSDVVIKGTLGADTFDLSTITLTNISEINGNWGNDTITGTDFDDVINGGAGDDILNGGSGNDTFNVGVKDDYDIYNGGAGYNIIRYVGGAADYTDYIGLKGSFNATNNIALITGDGTQVKILGSGGGDILDFSNITLVDIYLIDGGDGKDTIIGTDFDDMIDGGKSYDTLYGGLGNDTFVVSSSAYSYDMFDGGEGYDIIVAANSSIDYIPIEGDMTAANSIEEIDGVGANTYIRGHGTNNIWDFTDIKLTNITKIDGGDGTNTIIGTDFDDVIDGGGGHGDKLYGGLGNDTFLVSITTYDYFYGGEGYDTIKAATTSMAYIAIEGDMTAANSIEEIDGVGTNTYIQGSGAGNILDFSDIKLTNITKIDGGWGNDTITGTAFDDVILGGNDFDTLNGGLGNDTLDGGSSGDTLRGGQGNDILTGGSSGDLFIWESGDVGSESIPDVDHIIDFGSSDKIDLSGLLLFEENSDNIDNYLSFGVEGDYLVLNVTTDGVGAVDLQIYFDNYTDQDALLIQLSNGGSDLLTDMLINNLVVDV